MSLRAAAALFLCLSSTLAAQVLVPPPPLPPSAPSDSASLSQAPAPGPYSISGTIVSATTGAPLDRADVALATVGGSQIASTLTGETGTFRFDHLGAARYTLEASRRGYLTAGYQEHDQFETAIVTGPGLDSQNIRFTLSPGAVVSGVVTSDSGEPIGGARVTFYRQMHENGESRTVVNRSETTDDTGSYEFSRLRPGSYYISVTATPWYAFHPNPKNDANGNPLPADQQPHSPLDVAYPTTFYPNATDSASATPIVLSPGDRIEANLSLHAVPAIHLQIRIPQPSGPGRGISMPQLSTDVFGTEQSQPYSQVFMSGPPGNMIADIGGVAPGQYTLREYGREGEVSGPTLDLTTSQTVEFTASANTVDISGKLAMASGQHLPAGVTASLVPSGPAASGPVASGPNRMFNNSDRVSADGSFDFHSVAPGTYELEVYSSGRTLAVAQMAASGAEVQGSHFTVAGDAVLLAATLVSGSVTITGYAQSSGKAVGGAMILLVPRDPNASREIYRRDQSDSDGSFILRRVIPGAYTLVAIQDGWTLDWAHPEVIAPYLARGLRLQIADQQKTLTVSEPIAVQPR
ncbi:MAG TPA: carboxypeptidase-like regulatory domain-containing protein [Acidobacteriaceae bacterium]|jgi:hypothetical protein|nr:carboxypeptidase-like regulatory domain-containing protein [Acidobacteriaceae bacterium]